MTTTTPTLADWLLAQIEADEKAAREADALAKAPWGAAYGRQVEASDGYLVTPEDEHSYSTDPPDEVAAHIARHDPARVLAQCAAFRRIVRHHLPTSQGTFCISCSDIDVPPPNNVEPHPCPTLRALASIWRDRDGWREEWRA